MKLREFSDRGGTSEHMKDYALLKASYSIKRTVIDVDTEELGLGLRELRTTAGISLREMSRRMGVSASYLSDVELGRRNLNIVLGTIFMAQCSHELKTQINP